MPPSSPPRRISLLPPELDDIDAGWGEESPTVVPTRAPSIPARPPLISIAELPDEDYDERVTRIPAEPRDDFARRVMAAASETPTPGQLADLPPPDKLPTAPGEALDLVAAQEEEDEDVFDRPTQDGARAPNPSEYPTAPPPGSFPGEPDRTRTVPRVPRPRPETLTNLSRHELPTDPPPGPPTHRDPLSPINRRQNVAERDRATHREPLAAPRSAAERGTNASQRGPSPRELEDRDSQVPLSALERARRAVTPVTRPGDDAESGGLEFVGRLGSPPVAVEPLGEMKDRFAMGDFSGALSIAEQILTKEPDEPTAKTVAAKCRDVLYDMYASRIAGMDREVSVTMGPDQLRWLSLDHRAGFLLAMIDGGSTVDELLDVSGMPRLDALRIICDLLDQKVIGLGR